MIQNFSVNVLNEHDFAQLSSIVHDECGIYLKLSQRLMLQCRLQSRLRELGMQNFKQYREYLYSNEGRHKELVNLIDSVTTNTTHFFREKEHFNVLGKMILPQYTDRGEISIWSLPCSTGEEPYSILMLLKEYNMRHPGETIRYHVFGSDISTRALQTAKEADYPFSIIDPIPMEYRKRYLDIYGEGSNCRFKIKEKLAIEVEFSHVNLMDNVYPMSRPVDVLFIRNVLFYFDNPTKEKVIKKIVEYINPGGYLFLSHTESLINIEISGIKKFAPSVYQKNK